MRHDVHGPSRRPAGVRTLLLLSVLAALTGCSTYAVPSKETGIRAKPVVPAGGVLLRGAGATFPAMLYQHWFSVYQEAHPKSVITYEPVGSGEGIRRFIARALKDADEKVDFGASDAAMRDDEIAAVTNGALLVPLTAGSVGLAYNLPDVPELKLSREAYIGIFTGQIKNWNDPRIARANPGVKFPSLTIATVVRQDGSGTTFAFTKHLDAISDAWRSQFGAATLVNWPGNSMRASGNEGVAGRINQSLGSIGYLGYEFARKAGLKTALIENHTGRFVAPTERATAAAFDGVELPDNMRLYVPDPPQSDAYPIVTLTWILLYRNYGDARTATEVHDLFRWCLTDGQRYAGNLGYAPLPPTIQQRSLAELEKMKAGVGSQ